MIHAWSGKGPLSSVTEWHAFVVGGAIGTLFGVTGGLLFGLAAFALVLIALDIISGINVVRREPWYALSGLVIGFYLGTLFLDTLTALFPLLAV